MERASSLMRGVSVLAVVLALPGCAPMSVGQPVVTDLPRSQEERLVPNGAAKLTFEQRETHVIVQSADLCDAQQFSKIERTTVRGYRNDAPQNDWWAGIGGAVVIGSGVMAAVAPEKVRGSDTDLTNGDVRASGYALIGIGTALLAIPVIDAIRANREHDRNVTEVVEPGPTSIRNVPCAGRQRERPIYARYPNGREVPLGETDTAGRLDVNLSNVTPADWVLTSADTVGLFADGQPFGSAALKPLYDEREAVAWRLAESSGCATSVDVEACKAQEQYVARFPDGPHALIARAAISAAVERQRIAREAEAWKELDLRACVKPSKREVAAIEEACAPLASYIRAFPDGAHASSVRDAIRDGTLASAKAQAEEDRRASAQYAYASAGNYIPYEGNGGGPTVCADGMISNSSGRGTCSHHGGIAGGSSRSHGGSGGHRSFGGGRSKRR